MTALIYRLEPERIIIATDSLVTHLDLRPLKYCTKIFPLIHLTGVMCGTGSSQLAQTWFYTIQMEIIATDMEYLNNIAPERLRYLYQVITKESGQKLPSTIYHFGLAGDENKFKGYAYRAENNFTSESLIQNTLSFKPENVELKNKSSKLTSDDITVDDFIVFMKEQKRCVEDSNVKDDKKVGIGGNVHLFTMNRTGEMVFYSCHRFDDYSQMLDAMLENE